MRYNIVFVANVLPAICTHITLSHRLVNIAMFITFLFSNFGPCYPQLQAFSTVGSGSSST